MKEKLKEQHKQYQHESAGGKVRRRKYHKLHTTKNMYQHLEN